MRFNIDGFNTVPFNHSRWRNERRLTPRYRPKGQWFLNVECNSSELDANGHLSHYSVSAAIRDISTCSISFLLAGVESAEKLLRHTTSVSIVQSESGSTISDELRAALMHCRDAETAGETVCVLTVPSLDSTLGTNFYEIVNQETVIASNPVVPVRLILTCNQKLKKYFADYPERMHSELSSREFEVLVADILKDMGFDVETTPATRDGGFDIYARMRDSLHEYITLVECKKYAPGNSVGVELVRTIYGVHKGLGADRGMIVTTSSFTKPAIQEQKTRFKSVTLSDHDRIETWLQMYKN